MLFIALSFQTLLLLFITEIPTVIIFRNLGSFLIKFSKNESLIIGIIIWIQYHTVSKLTIMEVSKCLILNTATIGAETMIGYLVKCSQIAVKFQSMFTTTPLLKTLVIKCMFWNGMA